MNRRLELVQVNDIRQGIIPNRADQNLVLYIEDYFTKEQVNQYKKICPNIVAVLSNNLTVYDLNTVEFYGAPYFLSKEAQKFMKESYETPLTTRYAFTFNLNKNQINRYLLIKFVEWFEFKNFCYTWSGIKRNFDCQFILNELDHLETVKPLFDSDLRSFLLSPINLEKNWVKITDQEYQTVCNYDSYGSNLNTWKSFIADMTYDSAVTLIGESIRYDRAMMFTEKTLYSVLGLTFPIWVGGYQQAEQWKNYGFDVFEDIIDHSYQNYSTLIERIYYAFALNHDILSNLESAKELRKKHMPRLQANRRLLLDNHLVNIVKNYVANMPDEVQHLIDQHGLYAI